MTGSSARVAEEGAALAPDEVGAALADAERLERYHWVAQLCLGRRVLDVGCELGRGSRILAGAGAASVTGVDDAASVVDAARGRLAGGLTLHHAQLDALPFPENEFDLVVGFDVLDRVEDASRALDEMCRVLAPSGLLAVSSTNRDAGLGAAPRHRHYFAPEELRAAVAARLPNVEMYRQAVWVASAILDDAGFAAGDGAELKTLRALKTTAARPGRERHSVSIGSDSPLPPTCPSAVLADAADVGRWQRIWEEQQAVIHRLSERLDELARAADERSELLARLAEAESIIQGLQTGRHAQAEALRDQIGALEQQLDGIHHSRTWRVMEPVRRARLQVGHLRREAPWRLR